VAGQFSRHADANSSDEKKDPSLRLIGDGAGLYAPHLMHWGIPFPGKPRSSQVINARSETLTEKPMFRRLVVGGRCVVPANGFFEWALPAETVAPNDAAGKSRKKTKYLIRPSNVLGIRGINFFYMAGLVSRVFLADGAYTDCIVIITTRASSQMLKIHDRMPVMLDRSMADFWTSGADMKKVYSSGIMEPWSGSLDILSV